MIEFIKRDPCLIFVIEGRRDGQGVLQRLQLGTEFLVGAVLTSKREQLPEKFDDGHRRSLVAVVDMPVDIRGDQVKIKEIIKRWNAMALMMEIPKIAFKVRAIDFDRREALTKRRWPSWDERHSGPGLKGCKGFLSLARPVSIGEVGPIGL